MASKRKAAGNGASGAAKRIRSGPATPQSHISSLSDDDYEVELDDEDNAPPRTEAETAERKITKRLKEKYTLSTYVRLHGVANTGSRNDGATHIFRRGDHGGRTLKPDHADRPIFLDPLSGKIILESFSPLFKQAEAFLINVAEPVSRVEKVHEYTMNSHSLFAAVSVGYATEDIINQLEAYSKTTVPEHVREYISESTKSFGKVRLVLKHSRYYIESNDPTVLQELLRNPTVASKRVKSTTGEFRVEAAPKMGTLAIPGTKMAAGSKQVIEHRQAEQEKADEDEDSDPAKAAEKMTAALLEEDDDDEDQDQVHSFEVASEGLHELTKECMDIGYPLTEEYDFRNDEVNANLDIDLKPAAQIRPYQEQALSKMFGNGRARSGIIVLPCGAGKTLVGITAACTVKKGIIVLCTSAMSVVQWRAEFLKWSNISKDDIAVFTADNKDKFQGNTGVIISTYSMVTQSKSRSHDSQRVMDFITSREWGLMILDEVHVVPAQMFKKVTLNVHAHSKLGLTATLLREDDKIDDLNFIIGPKLYEANWQELSRNGYIARVQCAEVWCPMSSEFYTEYLNPKNAAPLRTLLFTMNPRKFQACQFLINYHESRGDKIIVFSDNVYALKSYAEALGKAFIFGGTPQAERLRILENFQYNEEVNTIFLSKIGDTSLDLPEATCLIQISSHYGSRRQEAQRLGRILRAKRRNDEGFNAFFYSLVSKDTQEMYYSSKRQMFLVDQGYAFKVITHLQGLKDMKDLAYASPRTRQELLADILIAYQAAEENHRDIAGVEQIDGDLFDMSGRRAANRRAGGARRTAGTLGELSGGQHMAYAERSKNRNKELKQAAKGAGKGSKFVQSVKRHIQKKKAVE